MTFYDSTEISKWQSDIIRGAHGGAVILMSPSDYPADHPQKRRKSAAISDGMDGR